MSENCCADRARPHPETRGQLAGHLRVAGKMFSKTSFVYIKFSTHRARVVGTASFCCKKRVTLFEQGNAIHSIHFLSEDKLGSSFK